MEYQEKLQIKGVRSIGLIDWFRGKKKRSSSRPSMVSRPSRTSPFDSYFSLYLPTAKAREQFKLYEIMRKAMPVLDAAIQRKVALLGDIKITTDKDKDEKWINDALTELEVNKFGHGLNTFLDILADKRYLYGIGVGEIVMTKNSKVHSLVNIETPTIEFVPKSNHPLDLVIAQNQSGHFKPVELNEDLILMSTIKGDLSNLYGVSMYAKLPFIAGILHTVFHTEDLVWERFGNLSYHINYEPESDNLTDEEVKKRMGMMKTEWQDSMRKKSRGEAADYYTTGKFTVKVLGAEGQILKTDVTSRVLLEQIIGNLGIPAWVLGYHWSTSERLSQKQLEILTAELNTDRMLIAPIVYKVVDTLCAGEGRVFPYEVEWDSLNLEDMLEKSRSRLLNAQAERYETETAIKRRNEGIIDQDTLAQELGYDKPAAPGPISQHDNGEQNAENNEGKVIKLPTGTKGFFYKKKLPESIRRAKRIDQKYKKKYAKLEEKYQKKLSLDKTFDKILAILNLPDPREEKKEDKEAEEESFSYTALQWNQVKEEIDSWVDKSILEGAEIFPDQAFALSRESFAEITGITLEEYNVSEIASVANITQENIDLITRDGRRYKREIKLVLKEGVSQGLNPKKIALNLWEKTGTIKNNLDLIARDQVQKAHKGAREIMAKIHKITKGMLSVSASACHICQPLADLVYDIIDGLLEQLHIGCRCTTILLTDSMYRELTEE